MFEPGFRPDRVLGGHGLRHQPSPSFSRTPGGFGFRLDLQKGDEGRVLVRAWLGYREACQLERRRACGTVNTDAVLEEEAAAKRESEILDVGDRACEGPEVERAAVAAKVSPVHWVQRDFQSNHTIGAAAYR